MTTKQCHFCHHDVLEKYGVAVCENHPVKVRQYASTILLSWDWNDENGDRQVSAVSFALGDNCAYLIPKLGISSIDVKLDFIPDNLTPENVQQKIRDYIPYI